MRIKHTHLGDILCFEFSAVLNMSPFDTVKNVLEIKQFTQLHKIIFENAQFVIGSNTLKTFIEKIYSQYIISHFLPYLYIKPIENTSFMQSSVKFQ